MQNSAKQCKTVLLEVDLMCFWCPATLVWLGKSRISCQLLSGDLLESYREVHHLMYRLRGLVRYFEDVLVAQSP